MAIALAAPLSAKLLKNGVLKTYKGYPHGMATTHADVINRDILAFVRDEDFGADPEVTPTLIVEPLPAE